MRRAGALAAMSCSAYSRSRTLSSPLATRASISSTETTRRCTESARAWIAAASLQRASWASRPAPKALESRTLPRLELSEDNITSALARDAGELLGELGAPLRELCVDLGHELDSRAELALATCDLGRLDLDERLAAPLDAAIAALAQSPS